MNLNVIEIQVKDWALTVAWWRSLGFKVLHEELEHKFVILGSDGGATIAIDGSGESKGWTPYIQVTDVTVFCENLKNRGIEVEDPEIKDWGIQAKIVDPENNQAYFYQITK